MISPPRKEAGKIVGVGTATYRCEVGTFKQVAATCDGGTDAYASTRATALPTPQNVALPKIGSDADLAPYKNGTVSKASTVTQLSNEVGTWESQMSKDMKAQEARMVAYTDTRHTESRNYTDTRSSQTLASATNYTNAKSAETLASANSYTDTKANQTLASANSYTDSKATATLNSANSYTNSKSTETLNSANAYTDSKATATLNSANTYTNNSSALTLENSKSYTDSKSASTLTAANNYTDQEVAGVSQAQQPTAGSTYKSWTLAFVGDVKVFQKGRLSANFCSLNDFSVKITPEGAINLYNGTTQAFLIETIPRPAGSSSAKLGEACSTATEAYAKPIVDVSGNLTGWQITKFP